MQTTLITGDNESARKKKALKVSSIMCQVSKEDTTILEPESATSTIQIAKVRELKRKLALSPFNSPVKVAIIHQVNQATLEAQNALLKILEEPPNNTCIILTAPRAEELLPTIVSRCQIVKVSSVKCQVSGKEFQSNFQLLTSIFQSGVGERLVYASKISKDKGTAIDWLKKNILLLREILLAKYQISNIKYQNNNKTIKQYNNLIKKFQKALLTLEKTNTNPRLLIENLLLEFPRVNLLQTVV